MMREFDTGWGGKLTVNSGGDLVSGNDPSAIYDYVDIDLRADAVADPTKISTLVFILQPCDGNMCRWGTITAPARVLVHLVQETMQTQLAPAFPNAKVPQNGIYDCETAAYMVMIHQLIKSAGTGDVAGWPLDALELREVLNRSETLYAVIQQVAEDANFSGFSIALPDDTKALKFHRAEVPAACAGGAAKPTRWGLIAAVGILVAGAVGATYAVAQRKGKKTSK